MGTVIGTLRVGQGTISNADLSENAAVARSKLAQDSLKPYVVDLTKARVWDAITTNLPSAAANDDLGLDGGTFGTSTLHITAGDLKNLGATTRYARIQLEVPAEYVDGQTVNIRFHAGMLTTVASVSATVDVEAYLSDEETGVGSDLCATAAQDCNSLTFADLDFSITATSLVAGSKLDCRIALAVNDSGTGTAVEAVIGSVKLLCDVKG